MTAEQKKASDRLEEAFYDRFANDAWFRTQLAATMSAADWAWLVKLAEWGLEQRRKDFKAQPGGTDMGDIMSLESWQSNINELVDKLCLAKVTKPRKPKKNAPRS